MLLLLNEVGDAAQALSTVHGYAGSLLETTKQGQLLQF